MYHANTNTDELKNYKEYMERTLKEFVGKVNFTKLQKDIHQKNMETLKQVNIFCYFVTCINRFCSDIKKNAIIIFIN